MAVPESRDGHTPSVNLIMMEQGKNAKENIRQFAPDGTCFQYYITEEIINNDGEKVTLNALDKDVAGKAGNPQNAVRPSDGFLGSFFKADDIYTEIVNATATSTMYQYHTAESPYISVSDDGLGFKVKELTQPAQITDTGADECTLQNIGEKITRTATIKNSYEPDLDNFQGKLIINKTWINHDGSNENTLNNDDFDDVKDYSFIVSRHTKNISERDMFKIETYNETDHMPKVTSLDTSNYFNFTVESPMTKYDSTDAPIGPGDTTTPVEYYKEVLKISQDSYSANMDEVKISVKIYKTADKYNRVEIQGLAIYAQDAIRYTYKLNEDFTNLKAYKNVNDLQNPLSGKMEDYTENNKTVTKREFDLRNELKVFELKLNKVFGKEYIPEGQTEKTIQKLDQADYHQYFNDDFVLNNPKIEFQLQRKEDGEDDSEYKVYKYRGDDWHKVELSGTDPRKVYSKSFKNLPKYSPDGNAYVYRVIERKAPDDAHYKILYSSNDTSVNSSQTDPVGITCDSDTATYMNTYVRNVFEAKQINVNKYWDDDNNADGLRPDNVRITIDEHLPQYDNLSAQTENIVRVLYDGDLDGGRNWTKKVELPKYYYNGETPVSGLT